MRSAPTAGRRSPAWAAYGAAWAFAFSLQSFYYAVGGTAGAETRPAAIAEPVLARDPAWVAIMWGTGAAKVLAGLLALALFRRWGGRVLDRLLLVTAWGAGVFLALYGAANLVQHALMVAGVVATPTGLGETAARWHLWLWDPWWILGGLLFVAAARAFRRGP